MKQRPGLGFGGTQLMIPAAYVLPKASPKAAKQQFTVADWDHVLVGLARVNRPGVFWWWGTRKIDNRTGAYCYICEGWITHYARNYPITASALADVDEHRTGHYPDAQKALEAS